MYDELRKKAEKKVQAKKAFFICAIVFAFTTIVLLMISFYLPVVAFWLKLPIPIFIMVLAILYVSAWGLPYRGVMSDEWEEDEIEKEMVRLYRQKKEQLLSLEDLSETEQLELRELEQLRADKDWEEDLV